MRHALHILASFAFASAAMAQIAIVSSTRPADIRPPAQRVVKLSVTPEPQPRPALAWRLLPSAVERTPGDAATLWLLATGEVRRLDEQREKIDQLLDVPLADLSPEAVRKALPGIAGPHAPQDAPAWLRFAHLAARREQCNWELTFRSEGFYALLPHLSNARVLARVLALKARLEVKEGRLGDAVQTLQAGYALARDLNQEAVLVQSLVGTAIVQTMNREVEHMIGQRGSPNLYWALAHLPRPFMDVRVAFENEMVGVYGTLPQLKDIRQRTITQEELGKVMRIIPALQSMTGDPGADGRFTVALKLATMYPAARAYAASEEKLTPEQIDAMPGHQLLALYMLGTYEQAWSEMSKWAALPYWQARPGMGEASRKLARMKLTGSPLLVLVPAVEAAVTRMMEADRQIATLQCIEALRAYAAEHDGALPARLQDLTETPAPVDPATGALFTYEVRGNTAVIDAPAPADERADRGWRYEITIVK